MALGSKKRDYVTEERSIRKNLKLHNDRMQELIEIGMTKEKASERAFKELFTI